MPEVREATRRCDMVWSALPPMILLFLLCLGREGALTPLARWLNTALAGVMIAASALLMAESVDWVRLRRRAQPGQPHWAIWGAAGLAVAGSAIAIVTRSVAALEWIFLGHFAVLALWAAWRAPALAPKRRKRKLRIADCGLRIKGNEENARILDYVLLTKPGLSGMVLVSVVMGFALASPGPLAWGRLGATLAGVGLLAGAAAAFNQAVECARDRRMTRTLRRPLPAGRLEPRAALRFGAALALAGMALLALTVGAPTAFLATFSFAVYLFLYTPMKRSSTLATLVGAVSGALPPLLGWLGAGQPLTPGALILFFILYLWQIPHFLAIVWKYRHEYDAAGFRLYGVLDRSGRATGLQALLYSVALLPVSLMMTWQGVTGMAYLMGAFGLGVALMGFSLAFALKPAPGPTRRLFIATIAYLPLLLLGMALDRWM